MRAFMMLCSAQLRQWRITTSTCQTDEPTQTQLSTYLNDEASASLSTLASSSTKPTTFLNLFFVIVNGVGSKEPKTNSPTKSKPHFACPKFFIAAFFLSPLIVLFFRREWYWYIPFPQTCAPANQTQILNASNSTISDEIHNLYISKLRDSVTFLPLKDIRFTQSAMTGYTWFMSSLNDTYEIDQVEHLYFPSPESNGRMLCFKGRHEKDGSMNSYALAWPESLPEGAFLLKGLSFVSETYYDYINLWHSIGSMTPFVSWSLRNRCAKPDRWVLYHWGELRLEMGAWVQNVMEVYYGKVKVETFENGENDGVHCFEKALVMRHSLGKLRIKERHRVFEQLRCKARKFCNIQHGGRWNETNEQGNPIIRFTLLMRRNSRSFKNGTLVTSIFAKECEKVDGCVLSVAQSENLSFCDQVRVLTHTDIVASPHGAQLTNMFFMDHNSSVEFFPRGWYELAGVGQHAHHWMADTSGMKHTGSWWEPLGKHDCPDPNNKLQCFQFYKEGKVGHNETYFAEWARDVISQVKLGKIEQMAMNSSPGRDLPSNECAC